MPRPQETKDNMQLRMKAETPSNDDLACWCGDALGTFFQLRKHQELSCLKISAITMFEWVKNVLEGF